MTPDERARHWCIDVRRGDPRWVRDTAPQIAELIRDAVAEERERCARKAEEVACYYSANNGDNKDVALLVAQKIREEKK